MWTSSANRETSVLRLAAAAGSHVRLWQPFLSADPGVAQLPITVPLDSAVRDIKWNHTYAVVAAASKSGKVSLHHYESGAQVAVIPETDNEGAAEDFLCMAFAKQSRYIVTGGVEQILKIWDCKTKKLSSCLRGHEDVITSVTYNNDNTQIISANLSGDVLVHNAMNSSLVSKLRAPSSSGINAVELSIPKRHILGTVSQDGSVVCWDLKEGKIKTSFLRRHSAAVQDLSFHKSNHQLLCSVGSDKCAQILSLNDHQTAALIETDTPLTSCDWNFDGNTLAIGAANGKISLYDTRKPSAPMKVLRAHESAPVKSLAFQNFVQKTNEHSLRNNGSKSALKQTPTVDTVELGPPAEVLVSKEISNIPAKSTPVIASLRRNQDQDVFSPVVDAAKLRERQLSIATRVPPAAASALPASASRSQSQSLPAAANGEQPVGQLTLRPPAQLEAQTRSTPTSAEMNGVPMATLANITEDEHEHESDAANGDSGGVVVQEQMLRHIVSESLDSFETKVKNTLHKQLLCEFTTLKRDLSDRIVSLHLDFGRQMDSLREDLAAMNREMATLRKNGR